MLQVIQYPSIQRMILPEGWIEEPAGPEPEVGAFTPLHALRVFHPPARAPRTPEELFSWYDPAHVSLTIYGAPPGQNVGDEFMLKLLTERPHQLTARQASTLTYFTRRPYPPMSSWQEMHTEVWNERIVLIAQGIDAGYREWVMVVDDRIDRRVPKLPSLSPGHFYSSKQLNYPDRYYTPAELERLLGVNQPECVPDKIAGFIMRLHEIRYRAPENVYASFLPQVMHALRTIEWKEQVSQPTQATARRLFSFLYHLLAKGQ